MMLTEAEENIPETGTHDFVYSNFNSGLLGLILECVYEMPYYNLTNQYISEDLQLDQTYLFEDETELGKNWVWSDEDAYAPAGAIISNIEDMLLYAQKQMDEESAGEAADWINELHTSLEVINATTEEVSQYGLWMDKIAYNWMLATENSLIWHDGGIGFYTSYLGFDKENQTAVVILSNQAISEAIPANVIGAVYLNELLAE